MLAEYIEGHAEFLSATVRLQNTEMTELCGVCRVPVLDSVIWVSTLAVVSMALGRCLALSAWTLRLQDKPIPI